MYTVTGVVFRKEINQTKASKCLLNTQGFPCCLRHERCVDSGGPLQHREQMTHGLHMPSFSQTQWTSCKRWSLEWAAPTGTQPCTVFGYKDFCGSTVLGTPESVGMNGQIDWQALQISHLVCSLAGQRCSEAWGTFSARTSQSITALTAWRKEEWRKEAVDIPPSKAENDLCSTRQILALFRGQPWGDC